MSNYELQGGNGADTYTPRRLRSVRWRYVPVGLLILAGLLLTTVMIGLVDDSQWGLMAAGVSLTSLAAVYCAILIGREVEIEGIVVQRTDQLQQEIAERRQAEAKLQEKNLELVAMQAELREMNQHLEERVRERTSAIERLLKQKEDLIVQLGHDLRSPLTPLVGLLPVLNEHQTDPKSSELLGVVARNVEHIRKLVERTLRLANLSARVDQEFDVRQVNLANTLDELMERRPVILEGHGVSVHNEIPPDLVAAADPVRLCEVFEDLVQNAVRFTPPGGTVTFRAVAEGEFVHVTAQDTGIGLTESQLENIFDEFYKADESRHDLDSSGLGLSICKRIIDKHGGSIWAESKGIGLGTVFHLTLPVRIKEEVREGSLRGTPGG